VTRNDSGLESSSSNNSDPRRERGGSRVGHSCDSQRQAAERKEKVREAQPRAMGHSPAHSAAVEFSPCVDAGWASEVWFGRPVSADKGDGPYVRSITILVVHGPCFSSLISLFLLLVGPSPSSNLWL
jgi:hypothetical protein